jgi:hypothetical protein
MTLRNVLTAFISALVGAVITLYVIQPEGGAVIATKSDRLSGSSTETAFLPERFGVPGTSQRPTTQ